MDDPAVQQCISTIIQNEKSNVGHALKTLQLLLNDPMFALEGLLGFKLFLFSAGCTIQEIRNTSNLEFDVRGKVVLVTKTATIETGEIKLHHNSVEKAKSQLALRLKVLRHAFDVVYSQQFNSMQCIGRICSPTPLINVM